MDVQRVCLIMVLIVVQFGSAGLAATTPKSTCSADSTSTQIQLPKSNCSCHYVTSPCGETSDHIWESWLSSALSIILFFFPMKRGLLTLGQVTESNAMFWWFICTNCMSSLAWVGYSKNCPTSQTGFPVFFTGLTGTAIHSLFLYASTDAVEHETVKQRKQYIAGVLIPITFFAALSLSSAPNGFLGLVFGAVAHLCRMKATNYEEFNWLLFSGSVIGLHKFIWRGQPMMYKIASDITASFCAVEIFFWCSPWIAAAVWRIERVEGAEGHVN